MGDRNACSRLSVRVLTSSEPAERRARKSLEGVAVNLILRGANALEMLNCVPLEPEFESNSFQI